MVLCCCLELSALSFELQPQPMWTVGHADKLACTALCLHHSFPALGIASEFLPEIGEGQSAIQCSVGGHRQVCSIIVGCGIK